MYLTTVLVNHMYETVYIQPLHLEAKSHLAYVLYTGKTDDPYHIRKRCCLGERIQVSWCKGQCDRLLHFNGDCKFFFINIACLGKLDVGCIIWAEFTNYTVYLLKYLCMVL